MADSVTLDYLNRVDGALRTTLHNVITSTKCPECDQSVYGERFNPADHWILLDTKRDDLVVVIGCEGYWIVNPASVGIQNENWSGKIGRAACREREGQEG